MYMNKQELDPGPIQAYQFYIFANCIASFIFHRIINNGKKHFKQERVHNPSQNATRL